MNNSLIKYLHFKFYQIVLFACLIITNPMASQNVKKEVKMGNETEKAIEKQIGFYQHSSGELLKEIGGQLVSNLDKRKHDYYFGIIDMQEPNAMALPNGHVYFSRGILVLANSEKELAGVMGHEIIHVNKSHSRKTSNKSIFTNILKVPGALTGVFFPTAGSLLTAPFALFDAGYSRKHEKQSDELGAQLASKSGFNPEGLRTILGKISKEQEIKSGSEERRSFLSTHPYTPNRLNDLDKVIAKLDYDETSESNSKHKLFLKKLEGIVIGENPANGAFIDNQFIHPELKFTMSYPNGWEGINLPTIVGFISPDEKSQLIFSLDDPEKSSVAKAEEFIKNHSKNNGSKPFRNESLKINGHPSQIISYKDNSGSEVIVFSILWLKRDKRMYRIALSSTKTYENTILDMAKSLHVMTKDEQKKIKQTVLHIVQAKKGETLKNLSKRTRNVLELEYTALINDLNPNTSLSEGQWVKIGVLENY
jgi:predicted Zn-dependent protease